MDSPLGSRLRARTPRYASEFLQELRNSNAGASIISDVLFQINGTANTSEKMKALKKNASPSESERLRLEKKQMKLFERQHCKDKKKNANVFHEQPNENLHCPGCNCKKLSNKPIFSGSRPGVLKLIQKDEANVKGKEKKLQASKRNGNGKILLRTSNVVDNDSDGGSGGGGSGGDNSNVFDAEHNLQRMKSLAEKLANRLKPHTVTNVINTINTETTVSFCY